MRIIEEEDTQQVLLSKQAPLTPKWVWGWKGGVRLGGGQEKGLGGGASADLEGSSGSSSSGRWRTGAPNQDSVRESKEGRNLLDQLGLNIHRNRGLCSKCVS